MKNKIDTIIFDLGGVLIDWNPMYVYTKVFDGDREKAKWFLDTVCTYDWNVEQDAGRTIEDAVAIKVAEFPEYENLIRLYYNKWHLMLSGAIDENVALFKQLKASNKYKLYALTNWSAETWPKAIRLFPFLNDFDGVVVSGIEKTRKPFPKIYEIILNRYHITPEKAVFIDDNLENLKKAKEFNIHTVHCKNPQQVKNDLKKYLNFDLK